MGGSFFVLLGLLQSLCYKQRATRVTSQNFFKVEPHHRQCACVRREDLLRGPRWFKKYKCITLRTNHPYLISRFGQNKHAHNRLHRVTRMQVTSATGDSCFRRLVKTYPYCQYILLLQGRVQRTTLKLSPTAAVLFKMFS